MLDRAGFAELYRLLAGDQTVDEEDGAPLDCGGPCHAFCCSGATQKYLLPGERAFLQQELDERGAFGAFRFAWGVAFDRFVEEEGAPCTCAPLRELRPFNCRIFPFGPVLDDDNRVIELRKGQSARLAPCWIAAPAPRWRTDAIAAWQLVLDDVDNRRLFARLGALFAWSKRLDRGEDAGHALAVINRIEQLDADALWPDARAFFERREDD